MKEPPKDDTVVIVRGKKVCLDPDNMKFDELSLSNYITYEYGWVDYFGKQLEFAQKDLQLMKIDYDKLYSEVYDKQKSNGKCTENQAKARALADDDVVALRQRIADQDEVVGLIQRHLRAWDRNHDNAQSRGHFMRKEMDKIHKEIYKERETGTYEEYLEEMKNGS